MRKKHSTEVQTEVFFRPIYAKWGETNFWKHKRASRRIFILYLHGFSRARLALRLCVPEALAAAITHNSPPIKIVRKRTAEVGGYPSMNVSLKKWIPDKIFAKSSRFARFHFRGGQPDS